VNPPPAALSETTAAVAILCILVVPLALAGLALVNTGLGRSRSAAHAMLASLSVVGVAVLVYFVCGFSWQGYAGLPARVVGIAGKPWDWVAAQPWFLRGVEFNGSAVSLAVWLQIFSVGLAAMIPLGAGADRWKLGSACASSALLAGVVYPLFAHWSWGGGWLAQLGFADAGGSASIQAVGGMSALSIAWLLGPRRGKYASDGMPAAIPGHNSVLVLFSCFLAWIGWVGLNGAGAILFAGAPAGAVALAAVNTSLAAAGAGLAAAAITRFRFGRPDASLCANGWFGGLVASSAGCVFLSPAAAALTGLVAGTLVVFSVEWLDLYLELDDPGGAISVHALGGLWGVLAAGLFSRGGRIALLPQVVGMATVLGFVLPATHGFHWLLNRFYPQRVSSEGERQGLDLHELGAGAYPEFVIHREDFIQR
jgi:ammonium transporter, Amt family